MWRRLVEVAPGGDASLQIQIRRCLAAAILDGRLPAGCALPSSRALATLLKVSRNTVALAYRQMVDEGFVIPR
ncbi:MAG: GntR family transcriptional regulator, partial [Acetobacteraceae bacterium]